MRLHFLLHKKVSVFEHLLSENGHFFSYGLRIIVFLFNHSFLIAFTELADAAFKA